MSGILVTLVSALFFLLASDILYDVLLEIFGKLNLISGSLSLSEKLFKIILMFAFSVLTLLKNLDFVFKAAPYAMGALVISTLAIIISFPMNFSSLDKGAIEPKEFTLDGLLLVASINGFAFTCHPSISPMLK
jgi:amino acid permease